jgi:hypothetical protein
MQRCLWTLSAVFVEASVILMQIDTESVVSVVKFIIFYIFWQCVVLLVSLSIEI